MKYACAVTTGNALLSRPARGAWIEMIITATGAQIWGVAPRTGRVD